MRISFPAASLNPAYPGLPPVPQAPSADKTEAVGFCMAEIYGVAVSPVWLATAFLIAIVLAVAAPPIPGGALTCYTILFVQLKIPMDASPISIARTSL